jgi:hypothetical protein
MEKTKNGGYKPAVCISCALTIDTICQNPLKVVNRTCIPLARESFGMHLDGMVRTP